MEFYKILINNEGKIEDTYASLTNQHQKNYKRIESIKIIASIHHMQELLFGNNFFIRYNQFHCLNS